MGDQSLQYSFKYNIRKLKYKYKLLYNSVIEINIIFGWTVMIVIFHLLLFFHSLDFNLIVDAKELKPEHIIEGILLAVVIWVSSLNNIWMIG